MSRQSKTSLIHYQYDAQDRLVSHRRGEISERKRFYCENRLTTEIAGDERLSIIQQGDHLLAQQHQHVGGLASTLLVTDMQRSVLNSRQANAQRTIAYSPYGYRTHESGLSSLLGFNGQGLDPMTGHYLLGNGYRAFNPVLMRFNSSDSMSPFGKGGLNAYGYCQGNPISRSDPTGHFFTAVGDFLSVVKAKYLSLKTGASYKPVQRFTRVSESAAVFVDKYKHGERLTIYGHGNSTGFKWQDEVLSYSGGVISPKLMLSPNELARRVESAGFNFRSFDSVRLLYCYSGSEFINLGNSSRQTFAQLFSTAVGLPVKGYKGGVKARNLLSRIEQLAIGETYNATEYLRINKKDRLSTVPDVIDYRPVSFQAEIARNIRIG
jgi:RHS repeat-associated protein